MADELIEREARTALMDALYRQAVDLHNLALNPMFSFPKFSVIHAELKEIESRLMAVQSDIGMLPFGNNNSIRNPE